MRAERPALSSLLLALGAGCGPVETTLDLPADLALVGVVALGPEGQVEEATHLQRWPESGVLPVVGVPGRLLVYGWRAGELPREAEGAALGPLRSCAARVPPPSLVLAFGSEGMFAPRPPEGAPLLGVDRELEPCAEGVMEAQVAVDLLCPDEPPPRCRPQVRRTGCALIADASSCGLGLLSLRAAADRPACGLPPVGWECTSGTRPGAAMSLECVSPRRCSLDAFVLPQAPAPFPARALPLTASVAYRHEAVDRANLVYAEALEEGWAKGMVVLPDRVLVTRVGQRSALRYCDPSATTWLDRVDLETVELVATTTAAPCLSWMLADGAGFLGLFADSTHWLIGRFTREARLLSARRLFELADHRVLDLERRSDGELIVVFRKLGVRHLWVLRQTDTASAVRVELGERPGIIGQVVEGEGELILFDDDRQELVLVRPEEGVVDAGANTGPDITRFRSGYHLTYDRATAEVFLAARGAAELLALRRRTPPHLFRVGFEIEQVMTDVLPWPVGQGTLLALGTAVNEWRATASLFDRASQRFLPGTQRLGEGVVSRAAIDDRGRAWLLLSWEGKLVRLDPP